MTSRQSNTKASRYGKSEMKTKDKPDARQWKMRKLKIFKHKKLRISDQSPLIMQTSNSDPFSFPQHCSTFRTRVCFDVHPFNELSLSLFLSLYIALIAGIDFCLRGKNVSFLLCPQLSYKKSSLLLKSGRIIHFKNHFFVRF